jgi:hypothetical protein
MTLCTFADVPWNAPFYGRHGFEELSDPGPELRALRATESRLGLDDLGRRVVMRLTLRPESVASVEDSAPRSSSSFRRARP